MAIPEKDHWKYKSNDYAPLFTPGSFVAHALKELGVFHGAEIDAAEFTVKDIYQLNIYDKNFDKPERCIEADYAIEYCQLFGLYRLELPGYSTITPYTHMNEHCPNHFENNVRPVNC